MEDISNLISEFSKLIENNELNDALKNLNNQSTISNTSESNQNISSFNQNNIDIKTFLKIKSALDKINSKENPNTNLLLALKPYLTPQKQKKIDQYIQFMNITNLMEILKDNEGDKNDG